MDGNLGKADVPHWFWIVMFWALLHAFHVTSVMSPPHLGEEFLVAFQQNGDQRTLRSDFRLLLLTGPSPSTTATISMKRPGLRMTVQAAANQPILVKIPPQAEMVGSQLFENAVVVKTTAAVTTVMINDKPSAADSAVIIPVHRWGTEYHVVTPSPGPAHYSQFVVATWDQPTTVNVHLNADVTFRGKLHPRGSTITILLEPFQAAQIQSAADLSGTRVVAQRPIAIFSGHTCVGRLSRCDHMVEQLRPITQWGTTFIVPPVPFRGQSNVAYISAAQPTLVKGHGEVTETTRELQPNHAVLYGAQSGKGLFLTSDAGIQVFLLGNGRNSGGVTFMPFFVTVPDVTSYCNSYGIVTLEGYDNRVLLVAKTAETSRILLNQRPLGSTAWEPVPGTEYSWIGINLGSGFGIHRVEHETAAFGAWSIGTGEGKRYGAEGACDSDPCRKVQCRPKETCHLDKGAPICRHDYLGTCTGSPSLQYHTFDGAPVSIHGGCKYTLTRYCGADPTLEPFSVEEGWSQDRSEAPLANVYVYAYNVSIRAGGGRTIQVNNKSTDLPVTLEAGKIRIFQNEGRTILQTDFGLQVTYDEDQVIMVAVPSSYFGATCGLCGNFNEDTEDEAMVPNGIPGEGDEGWAESWRDPSCQKDCGDQETPWDTEGCGINANSTSSTSNTSSTSSSSSTSSTSSTTSSCFHNNRFYKLHEEFWEDSSCHKRCRCEGTGIVKCNPGKCKSQEKCVTVNGISKCEPNKHYTCIGTGDPHYTTFDGKRFDFQGSCIYQFAALCTPKPMLVPFNVTVENNHRGSRAVSFTKTVTLEVYGSVISMSQEHPRKVKVDGTFVSLPFTHPHFSVFHRGVHGFVVTDFGLTVTFDWYSYARAILPRAYSGAVCGLCGNANGDPEDDFVTPGGHHAPDETRLGESWKVGDVPGCSAGCGDQCPVCDTSRVQPYRGDRYCGVIAQAGGPFQKCHGVIDPKPFLQDCAFDACHYRGHRDTVCQGVAAYVTACQSHGVDVETWRTVEFCDLSCPPHSHYELCGSPCQPTCLTPSIPAACPDSPCSEGCFCDHGYILSGSDCVPRSECGCEYHGRYYQKDIEFYPSCRERCRCGANGAVTCQEAYCGAHEECRVEDGVLGCHPTGYGRLVVSGDPHYVTFDGRSFNIPGSCTYILAQLCKPAPRLVNFTVLVEHEAGSHGDLVTMKRVVVSIHGYTVTMERGRRWEVKVDSERYTLPLVMEDNKLRIGQEGNNIVLHTTAGVRVLYNVATFLLITVPNIYRGRLCGLGGDYDGDPSDDFRLPTGALAGNTQEFITSWKIPEKDGACSDGCEDGMCGECDVTNTASYSRNGSCGIIRDAEGPFQACHPHVSPMEYFTHCVHDLCAAGGDRGALCHALQAYVAACQAAGAVVKPWRTKEFCPLSCPPNSHYELCTRTCDVTCAALVGPAPCTWGCFEGCQCNEGFVFDGETCVSPEHCGCFHMGRYLKAGETVTFNNCSKECHCHPLRGLVCRDMQCHLDQVCATHDGSQVCTKSEGHCQITPGATLTTFDGVPGLLLASGTYKVSALCDEEAPDWFKVVVEVSDCHDMNVPAATAAIVFVREGVVSVNGNMEVWVNGLFTRLPATISDSVSVTSSPGNVTVTHRSGMSVTVTRDGEATITVASNLAARLCAPCGNFNGNPRDDLKLPDGRDAQSVGEVVDMWKSRDFAGCHISHQIRQEVDAPIYPAP
ncbi:IgGFc-binding protein-like isoform X1 [Manacus candei]|uniref:IgGFc-binding protein-like isoform X1 n=1 Tax=Manacus candei TaxID=415023 RepID=UPI00222644EB|nr:IgGFc-binding protein-like isoform X1 [Manacus candei]